MAHFLFISINDINTHGLRMLSSYLKERKHKTSIIFLKRPGFPYTISHEQYFNSAKRVKSYDWAGVYHDGTPFRYSRGPEISSEEQTILVSLIQKINPDVIGFSVTAPLINRVAKITDLVKNNFNVPIIWGGAGATIDPEKCSQHCDYVCVGEGEMVVADIAERIDKRKGINDVNGLCYIVNNQFIKNPLHHLITDLNSLPFPDISPDDKYLIEDNSITEGFSEISYSGRYHVMGSRGCPFKCSYCTESYYKNLYANEKYLRRRTPQSIINELKHAKLYINFKEIQFEDEIFSLNYEWLKTFKELYIREINLPFSCYIYPIKNLEKKLFLLKEAGVYDVCLSLQSGSKRINKEVFQREFDPEVYVDTARQLNALGITFYTDVITFNQFEHEEDLVDTLNLLLSIPKPIVIFINKLYILKNTVLEEMVEKNIYKNKSGNLPKRIFDYYSRLFWFTFSEGQEFIEMCKKVTMFRFYPILLHSDPFLKQLRDYFNKEKYLSR